MPPLDPVANTRKIDARRIAHHCPHDAIDLKAFALRW